MTAPAPGLLAEDHPNDVCECGDYRHQHVDGTGRCIMPDNLTHGFEPCLKFRLSEKAPRIATPDLLLQQTIGWLNMFIRGMTPSNWRDMQTHAELQLDDLPAAIAAVNRRPTSPADVADIRARCEAAGLSVDDLALIQGHYKLLLEGGRRNSQRRLALGVGALVYEWVPRLIKALQSALAEVATLTDRIGKLETQGLMQAHENATLTAERDLAAFGNAQGHGDPCHMCGEPIDSYAGNASRWGTALPIGGGIMAWHHKGCITRALQPAAATGVSTSLLRNADEPLPPGCYCKPGKCMAPKIMGRQLQCRDPEKAAATGGEG